MIKILLSAGHGAGKEHNRGSVCSNEGDNNYNYSLALQKELLQYDGVQVDLVRKKITDNPSNTYRAQTMAIGYDLYLSLHSNGGSSDVRGTEVFDSLEKPNKKLAQSLCDATSNYFKHRNRGVKYRESETTKGKNYYGELRDNKAKSAMIIEHGFHTNRQDCLIFRDKHEDIAKLQAKIIADFYGLKLKTPHIDYSKPSDWAKKDWDKAMKLKLTDGTNPRKEIVREQMISIISRYLDLCNGQKLTSKLTSNNKITPEQPSNWAKDDWKWAYSNNITDGKRPLNNITREEFISMLMRHYNAIGGK